MFNYWGSATPLSIRVIPFYSPTRVWFQFLHLLANTIFCVLILLTHVLYSTYLV